MLIKVFQRIKFRQRIAVTILAVPIFFLSAVGAEPQSEPTVATTQPIGRGVMAEYAFTIHSASDHETVTLFTTVLVTTDQWAIYIHGISPHWVVLHVDPYPVDLVFSSTSESALMSRPGGQLRELFSAERLANPGILPRQDLHGLLTAKSLASVWKIPADVEQQFIDGSVNADRDFSGEYGVRFRDRDFPCSWSASVRRNGETSIFLKRILSGNTPLSIVKEDEFTQFTSENRSNFLLTRSRLSVPAVQLKKWNAEMGAIVGAQPKDYEAVGAPGSDWLADRYLRPYAEGGRNVEIKWQATEDGFCLPSATKVTLGESGSGMFLRSAKLIRHQIVDKTSVDAEIAVLADAKREKSQPQDIGTRVGKRFWPLSPPNLTAEDKELADSLDRELADVIANPIYPGDAIQATQKRVTLAVATDATASHELFMARLTEHFELLESMVDSDASVVSAMKLQSMLVQRKRLELVPALWRVVTERPSSEAPVPRLRKLLSNEGGSDAHDLHCIVLANAINDVWQSEERDPILVREAIIQICYKLANHQGNFGVESHYPAPIPWEYSAGDQLLNTVTIVSDGADGKLLELCHTLKRKLEGMIQ